MRIRHFRRIVELWRRENGNLLEDAGLLLALPQPPGLDELPVNVDGVVEVQQQTLAAIEKAETEEIVIDEGGGWVSNRVP
jgi:hypothetical protein